MFQQTFVDSSKSTKKQYTIMTSLVVQIVCLGALTLLPLIYTEVLPDVQLHSLLMAPTPPPATPKAVVHTADARPVVRRMLNVMIAPVSIPHTMPRHIDNNAPDVGVQGGVQDPTAGSGVPFNVIGAVPGDRSVGPPPATAEPKKSQPVGPVRVGGAVAESKLVQKVLPIYPQLAKSARVDGVVEFSAVINKEGRIENLRLVRGHPLLVNAAREAVSQWRYQPTLLNGQPVEVITNITVHFRLSQ
jgi:protein TonB